MSPVKFDIAIVDEAGEFVKLGMRRQHAFQVSSEVPKALNVDFGNRFANCIIASDTSVLKFCNRK